MLWKIDPTSLRDSRRLPAKKHAHAKIWLAVLVDLLEGPIILLRPVQKVGMIGTYMD